jgi:adenylosuccinate synthase
MIYMGVKAVVGMNWGDEAKGRMVDYLAREADCVIRFQGGDNAGHTVINEYGKLVFQNFPCGISYENVLNIIAPGSVDNPESFAAEMCGLIQKGIETGNIMISDKAILILPFHLLLDRLEEERLGDEKYGSTLRGMAPAYGGKYLKKGIQAGELLYPEYLKEHLSSVIAYNNLIIQNVYKSSPINFKEATNGLWNTANV